MLQSTACDEGEQGRSAASAPREVEPVSELTTNRLSVYLRCLNALDAAGVRTVSSQALAEQFHLNAAQIRKDLAYFGEFGVRGVGYYVKELRRHLRQILGLDRGVRVAIMGAGNLGLALADYPGFREEGFEIAALFDTRAREDRPDARAAACPSTTSGTSRRSSAASGFRIAVIAVPGTAAQAVVNTVVAAGIKADPQLFARRAEGAAGRQAEERGPDRLAREPVVLSGAGGKRWLRAAVDVGARRSSVDRLGTTLSVSRVGRDALSHVDARGEARMVDVSGKGRDRRARPSRAAASSCRARRCGRSARRR